MKLLRGVVWFEGMHLGPHHFQAQTRYFEDSADFSATLLRNNFAHGFARLNLNAEALANGTVTVVDASGILPDGLPFDMPVSDALPPPRNFTERFRPEAVSLTVYLALPRKRPDAANCAVNGKGSIETLRYVADEQTMTDETTGRDEKQVVFGRKNFRIALENELTAADVALPLVRVMRSGTGGYVQDPSFIPTCVQISASSRLMSLLARLVDMVEEKSRSLTRGSRSADSSSGFAQADIASFWFLHTVNVSLAPLRHFYNARQVHPEDLFLELARLGGALCTFSLDSHPRILPQYEHDAPDASFSALDEHIRSHLDLVVPVGFVQIPLTRTADWYWVGPVADERCFHDAIWILGLRSTTGATTLAHQAPDVVKVCSEKFITELVRRGMRGLALQHVPVPPPSMPARPDTQYFAIQTTGPIWTNIRDTGGVGIYVPAEIPAAEADLLVIFKT